jgi:hypothetical protein
MKIRAISVDAAFANMGFAVVDIEIADGKTNVYCVDLQLCRTSSPDRKTVRKSSEDLRRAIELCHALKNAANGAFIAFAEVPSGSQSAAAARALGIAVGVLASCPVPVIEVSPMEVKRVINSNSKVKVSKADVISWAVGLWPKAPWLRLSGKPSGRILKDNEHLADAMAAVIAGIQTPEFKRLIALQNAIPNTDNNRPTSRKQTRVRLQVETI